MFSSLPSFSTVFSFTMCLHNSIHAPHSLRQCPTVPPISRESQPASPAPLSTLFTTPPRSRRLGNPLRRSNTPDKYGFHPWNEFSIQQPLTTPTLGPSSFRSEFGFPGGTIRMRYYLSNGPCASLGVPESRRW